MYNGSPEEGYPAELAEGIRMGVFELSFTEAQEITSEILYSKKEEGIGRLRECTGLPPAEFDELQLGIDEILVNAIKHGNKMDPHKRVRISYTVSPEKLTLNVTDEGEGFALEQVPDPLNDAGLKKNSGRGLFITRSAFDCLDVERNPNGCTVKLEKKRGAASKNH